MILRGKDRQGWRRGPRMTGSASEFLNSSSCPFLLLGYCNSKPSLKFNQGLIFFRILQTFLETSLTLHYHWIRKQQTLTWYCSTQYWWPNRSTAKYPVGRSGNWSPTNLLRKSVSWKPSSWLIICLGLVSSHLGSWAIPQSVMRNVNHTVLSVPCPGLLQLEKVQDVFVF